MAGRRRDKRLEENTMRVIIQLEKYFTEREDGAEAGREQEVAGRRPEDRRGLIVQLSWSCRGGLWRGWQRTRGLQNSSLMFKYILSVIFLMLKLFRYCSTVDGKGYGKKMVYNNKSLYSNIQYNIGGGTAGLQPAH